MPSGAGPLLDLGCGGKWARLPVQSFLTGHSWGFPSHPILPVRRGLLPACPSAPLDRNPPPPPPPNLWKERNATFLLSLKIIFNSTAKDSYGNKFRLNLLCIQFRLYWKNLDLLHYKKCSNSECVSFLQTKKLLDLCPKESSSGILRIDQRAQDAVIALGIFLLESGLQVSSTISHMHIGSSLR